MFGGYEGLIFGVIILLEFEFSFGLKFRLLVSCSDDRMIRIWDIIN